MLSPLLTRYSALFMIVLIFYFFNIQAVIEAGLIAPLVNLLHTAEFDIKKEAAWAISNATSGGNNDQIKYALFSQSIKK